MGDSGSNVIGTFAMYFPVYNDRKFEMFPLRYKYFCKNTKFSVFVRKFQVNLLKNILNSVRHSFNCLVYVGCLIFTAFQIKISVVIYWH